MWVYNIKSTQHEYIYICVFVKKFCCAKYVKRQTDRQREIETETEEKFFFIYDDHAVICLRIKFDEIANWDGDGALE